MTRMILRALNAPGLILLVVIGTAIQTSLFNYYPFLYLQPDVVLLAVIWCALRRDFTEGGIITLIVANIAEVHSGSPQGIFLISYMLIYLVIRMMDRYFLLKGLSSLIGLTLFASVFWKLSNLGILHLLGISDNQWRHTLALLFPGAIMQGVIGTWIYRWLEKFDWTTYKNPNAEKETGDELQLDEEGL